jgi:hypothetical protein
MFGLDRLVFLSIARGVRSRGDLRMGAMVDVVQQGAALKDAAPVCGMPKCKRLVMIENSVVSCPPCCVTAEVNAPPTFPCKAPRDVIIIGAGTLVSCRRFSFSITRPPAISKPWRRPSPRPEARETGAQVDIKRVPELVPDEVARNAHYKVDQAAPIAKVDDLAAYDFLLSRIWLPVHVLRNIDHDNLCIFDCRDPDDGDVCDGGAITRVNSHAVDVDGTRGRHQVSVPSFAKRIFDRLADLELGPQHAGTRANGQCVDVAFEAASEGHKTSGAIFLGKRLRPPGRRAAVGVRGDPNLENQRWHLFRVVFGVPDAGPGTHNLDVSRFGFAFVAETIPVCHRSLTHECDDFHVGVRMRRKVRMRSDLIVIPDTQGAPAPPGMTVPRSEGKVPLGL